MVTYPEWTYLWTHDTGTHEMPAVRRGVPIAEQPTEVLHVLDLRPQVPPAPRRLDRIRGAVWLTGLTVAGAAMYVGQLMGVTL